MDPIKISPTNLATMSSPEFCPRCFYRLLKNRFKVPFRKPMPGIMHSLDSFEKQLARVWLSKHRKLPKFFGRFERPKSILDTEWVSFTDAETGITVRGKIDIGLQFKDGTVVVDNKSARYHGDDDVMLPLYRTQQNCYGRAMDNPENPILAVCLLYYEFAPLADDEIPDYVDDEYAKVRFAPELVELDYAPEKYVQPLLEDLRQFWEMTEEPDPREGCVDCELLDALLSSAPELADAIEPKFMDRREAERFRARQRYLDAVRQDRLRQLDAIVRTIQAAATPCGVLANWTSAEE